MLKLRVPGNVYITKASGRCRCHHPGNLITFSARGRPARALAGPPAAASRTLPPRRFPNDGGGREKRAVDGFAVSARRPDGAVPARRCGPRPARRAPRDPRGGAGRRFRPRDALGRRAAPADSIGDSFGPGRAADGSPAARARGGGGGARAARTPRGLGTPAPARRRRRPGRRGRRARRSAPGRGAGGRVRPTGRAGRGGGRDDFYGSESICGGPAARRRRPSRDGRRRVRARRCAPAPTREYDHRLCESRTTGRAGKQ